ncbi:MAG: hypothetical protein LBT46_04210 [Planctomycetaceae bacterium]|jgi:hypothetical protein|nr:hypothetical protein [Planctomycetaceae bacterium]
MTIKITDTDLQTPSKPNIKIGIDDLSPAPQPSYQPNPSHTPNTVYPPVPKSKNNDMRILAGIIGGVLLLLVSAGVFLTANSSSSNNRNNNGNGRQTHEAAAINDVNVTVHKVFEKIGKLDTEEKWKQMVQEVRRVNTSACPPNFRATFLAMIHALEDRIAFFTECNEFKTKVERMTAKVGKEINDHNSTDKMVGDLFESFLRGTMGDPFGKTQEVFQEEKELKDKIGKIDAAIQADIEELEKKEKRIKENIYSTFQKLEEIAVQYNAVFNAF